MYFSKTLKILLSVLIAAGVVLAGLFLINYLGRTKEQPKPTLRQAAMMRNMPEAIEAGRRVLGGEFANDEKYIPLLAKVVAVENTTLTFEEVRFGMSEEGGETSSIERSLSQGVIVVEVEGLDDIRDNPQKFSPDLSWLSQKEIPLSLLQAGDIVGVYQDRYSYDIVKIVRFPRAIVEKLPLNL